MKLANKIAVVTGGGQGIGREICLNMARHGATVVVADIQTAGAEETVAEIARHHGPPAKALLVNVTNEEKVAELINNIRCHCGALHIVVNNSGVAGPMGPTEKVSLQAWQDANAVNVDGVFLMCKHAIPLLRDSGGGSIINIASISAKRALLERANYCAGKGAVLSLTRALALECGPWGIRVNTVCPGAVDGPRQNAILEHAAKAQGKSFEEVAAAKKSASPLHTFVPPQSVADVVSFLASAEASMMTGQDINVSAGVWMI